MTSPIVQIQADLKFKVKTIRDAFKEKQADLWRKYQNDLVNLEKMKKADIKRVTSETKQVVAELMNLLNDLDDDDEDNETEAFEVANKNMSTLSPPKEKPSKKSSKVIR